MGFTLEPHQIIMKAFIFVTLLAAAFAPAAVATAYLADEPEVAAAKAEFMKVFDAYKNGEIPAPVAPAAPVVEAAAPVFSYAAYPQYYNNWNYGAFYNNWAGYG